MMATPDQLIEIFLQPGDFYFGDRTTRIRTLLGSCVAITVWHPQLLIGGMCHYMLPSRETTPPGEFDGRYADEAMKLFLAEMKQNRTHPTAYVVKLFGGGNMFPSSSKTTKDLVGDRNIEAGRALIQTHGMIGKAEDLGGIGHRNVIFDVWSGDVWVKRPQQPALGAKRGE